jgi:hypothetical protein
LVFCTDFAYIYLALLCSRTEFRKEVEAGEVPSSEVEPSGVLYANRTISPSYNPVSTVPDYRLPYGTYLLILTRGEIRDTIFAIHL